MVRNPFLVSLLMLVITLTLAFSLNFSFAEDKPASEGSHEHEAEKTVASSMEDPHVDTQEPTVQEEHSLHESGVEGDVPEHEASEASKHVHMHEAGEGSHVHNSVTAEAAQWVGVATLLATASILGIKIRTNNRIGDHRFIVLTLAVGAGVAHLLLVPDHLADVSIEHAGFFTAAGVAQISFGILFMLKPAKMFAIIGMTGNIGNIILYWVTRIGDLPAPFGAPEGIDTVGIVTKIVEISLVALLIYLALHFKKIKPVEASKV